MFDLTGLTARVTGAGGGIGSAIARGLAAQGARVALSGTREDALKAVAAEIGGDAGVLPCNLSDPADVDGLVPRAVEALGGRVDIIVNNAGVTGDKLANSKQGDVWDPANTVQLERAVPLD